MARPRPSGFLALIFLVFPLLSTAAPAASGPTEASLREAWERVQREDPKTDIFQKVSEDTYRFKTKRFPFDGELRLLSVEVGGPIDYPDGEGFTTGTVNAELVGGAEEIYRLHPQAYGLWAASHSLYYDSGKGRWLTAKEFSSQVQKRTSCWSWWGPISGNLFWILFLVLAVLFLTLLGRKTTRQMNSAMAAQEKALAEQARAMGIAERGLEVTEDSNRLLREIRDALRRGEGGPGSGGTPG